MMDSGIRELPYSDSIYIYPLIARLKVNRVLDFTGGFGLKVRQVSTGFGCGEGYFSTKIYTSSGAKHFKSICNKMHIQQEGGL